MRKAQQRNKRMITLDLSKPDAAPIFQKLIAGADGLMETFRTGTMERWSYS